MKKPLLTVLLLLCAILLCCAACGRSDPTEAAGLTALQITQPPAKTAYIAGEPFDKTGMVVMGLYSDGTQTEITVYTVDQTTLAEGNTSVTVRYKGLTAEQAVTVSAAALESSAADAPSTDAPVTEAPTEETGSLTLVNAPVRQTYVAGEKFDPVGILLCRTKGTETELLTACTCPDTALTAGTTAVTVTCGGMTVDVPVTVAAGSPMVWGEDSYAQLVMVDHIYAMRIDALGHDIQLQTDIDIGLVYDGQVLNRLLPHTCAAGVASFAELLEEVDYHLFYGRSSMVIKVNYDYGDLEETLDRLYFESGFIGSCMSIKGQALADGYIQIIVRYYSDTLMSIPRTAVIPTYLEFAHTASTRPADYAFAKIDAENGIAVYNSEQAIWALTHGYSIAPVAGSPVEAVLERAKEILVYCCDDTMTPFQKLYNVYYYLETHATYDSAGEEWAAYAYDPVYESDMFSSMLTSFRAEGPLLYGSGACYGYAKSLTLLLGLEGFEITRVVARDASVIGRSQFMYDKDSGEYMESIGTHSYSYVRIDGCDYLIDGTYAFAGAPELLGQECTIYRDFCVGYSKDRHAEVYVDLEDDPYCSSAAYNPADFDVELLGSYDGGADDCLLEDGQEVADYLDALAAKATVENSCYAFSVTAAAAGYQDANDFRDTVTAQLEAAFGACDYWRFVRAREVNGVDCYTLSGIVYLT